MPTNAIATLQTRIGVVADGAFGPRSKAALLAALRNPAPAPATEADFARVAADLGVSVAVIKAVRKVEAPRGAFDDGRPSILYERHVFARNTVPPHRFDSAAPLLSGPPYGKGGYGPYSAQYGKLADACALDPAAAFEACSWGAFQVLGEGAVAMGYASAIDMAFALRESEAAHLESFARFCRMKGAVDDLRLCKYADPASCIPFVKLYNGTGYAEFDYHHKLSAAIG